MVKREMKKLRVNPRQSEIKQTRFNNSKDLSEIRHESDLWWNLIPLPMHSLKLATQLAVGLE